MSAEHKEITPSEELLGMIYTFVQRIYKRQGEIEGKLDAVLALLSEEQPEDKGIYKNIVGLEYPDRPEHGSALINKRHFTPGEIREAVRVKPGEPGYMPVGEFDTTPGRYVTTSQPERSEWRDNEPLNSPHCRDDTESYGEWEPEGP